jgi:hypothetical protein
MLDEFAQQVLSCATVDGVQAIFRAEIARHGYTNSAYRMVVPTAAGLESRFLFRNWSGEWVKQFKEIASANCNNFAVNEARRRITPFTWRDIRAGRPFSAGEEKMWKEAHAFGWRDAFVLPVHGPRGYLATVSMASMSRDLDLSARQRLRLQMIALIVHEHCGALDPVDLGSDREIPPRSRARKARRAHPRAGGRAPRAAWVVLGGQPDFVSSLDPRRQAPVCIAIANCASCWQDCKG